MSSVVWEASILHEEAGIHAFGDLPNEGVHRLTYLADTWVCQLGNLAGEVNTPSGVFHR